jgi:OmpA family protein
MHSFSTRAAFTEEEGVMADPRKKSSYRWILAVGLLLFAGALLFESTRPSNVASEATITGADLPAAGRMTPPPPPVPPGLPGGQAGACAADVHCPMSDLCISGSCRPIAEGTSVCDAATVRFSLFLSDIGESEHASVERMARCLRADRPVVLKIDASPDPQSPPVASLALAERRAKSVSRALAQRGVPEDKLRLVHYGEHELLCGESDEACWAENRRASTNTSP